MPDLPDPPDTTIAPAPPPGERTAAFSVVIPAHDEEQVVARCLREFLPGLEDGEAEVVVVANGCSDRTADRAREFAGVAVVELSVASKVAALNAGDASVSVFPRVYLDADIVVTTATLRELTDRLRTGQPRAGSPRPVFVTQGRPWSVRAFYSTYTAMPYASAGMIGTGLYAVSAAGRARFAEFPQVSGDDLFVQRHFGPAERVVLDSSSFLVETPRDLRSLLRVRTRVAFGNAELATTGGSDGDFGASTSGSVSSLIGLLRREPRRLPAVAVYTAVTAMARLRARGRSAGTWHRDSSTR